MSIFRNIVWFIKGCREYTKSGFEAASKSFAPERDVSVNICHRSFMVTGANSGIGKIAALNIAKKGAVVHLVCRNEERGQAALKELKEASGNEKIHLHILDISRPRDVKQFVHRFCDQGHSLNVLVNNAGVLVTGDQRQVTPDDLEVTFATNTLGTHVLTKALLPLIESSDDPRVITVSSGGMLVQKLNIDDLQFNKMSKFDGTMAYAQTKRHQVIMNEEFAKAYPRVHFSSMHPGWADTQGVRTSIPDFYDKMKDKLRTEEQGADTIVWLATSDNVRGHPSGLFFQDRKPVATHLPLAWTKASSKEREDLMSILDEISCKFI